MQKRADDHNRLKTDLLPSLLVTRTKPSILRINIETYIAYKKLTKPT